jgi:hypothetical protein
LPHLIQFVERAIVKPRFFYLTEEGHQTPVNSALSLAEQQILLLGSGFVPVHTLTKQQEISQISKAVTSFSQTIALKVCLREWGLFHPQFPAEIPWTPWKDRFDALSHPSFRDRVEDRVVVRHLTRTLPAIIERSYKQMGTYSLPPYLRGNLASMRYPHNKDFVYVRSDKDRALVKLPLSKYMQLANEHLEGRSYTLVGTLQEGQEVDRWLKSVLSESRRIRILLWPPDRSSTDTQFVNWLLPQTMDGFTIPKFRLLVKTHKKVWKGRPIAGAWNWVTTAASKYISHLLQPAVRRIPTVVKDSDTICKAIKNRVSSSFHWQRSPPKGKLLLASADVESMYPNIPLQEGLRALSWFTNNNPVVLELAHWVLTSSCVQFGSLVYKQVMGTAMGTNFAPEYANIVMWYAEAHSLLTPQQVDIRSGLEETVRGGEEEISYHLPQDMQEAWGPFLYPEAITTTTTPNPNPNDRVGSSTMRLVGNIPPEVDRDCRIREDTSPAAKDPTYFPTWCMQLQSVGSSTSSRQTPTPNNDPNLPQREHLLVGPDNLRLLWMYARYLDDLLLIFFIPEGVNTPEVKETIREYLPQMFSQHTSLKLSEIVVSEHTVTFLDLEITLSQSGGLAFNLYTKPSFSFMYIPPISSHPPHVFKAWMVAEMMRITRRCSKEIEVPQVLLRLLVAVAARGYSPHIIRQAFREYWSRRNALTHTPTQVEKQIPPETIRLIIPYHPGFRQARIRDWWRELHSSLPDSWISSRLKPSIAWAVNRNLEFNLLPNHRAISEAQALNGARDPTHSGKE